MNNWPLKWKIAGYQAFLLLNATILLMLEPAKAIPVIQAAARQLLDNTQTCSKPEGVIHSSESGAVFSHLFHCDELGRHDNTCIETLLCTGFMLPSVTEDYCDEYDEHHDCKKWKSREVCFYGSYDSKGVIGGSNPGPFLRSTPDNCVDGNLVVATEDQNAQWSELSSVCSTNSPSGANAQRIADFLYDNHAQATGGPLDSGCCSRAPIRVRAIIPLDVEGSCEIVTGILIGLICLAGLGLAYAIWKKNGDKISNAASNLQRQIRQATYQHTIRASLLGNNSAPERMPSVTAPPTIGQG